MYRPGLPNPPPDPNSDNFVLFFGRQNSRFESHKKRIAKMWGGEGDILTTLKEQLKVQYISIFEEIDSFS